MDCISLQNIDVSTHIGVPESERQKAQHLLVSVKLFGSLTAIGSTDDVSKGIDYAEVTQAIVRLAKAERRTLECFAEDTAAMLLQTFGPESVTVTVQKKPDLPLESVSVTITRP